MDMPEFRWNSNRLYAMPKNQKLLEVIGLVLHWGEDQKVQEN